MVLIINICNSELVQMGSSSSFNVQIELRMLSEINKKKNIILVYPIKVYFVLFLFFIFILNPEFCRETR